MAHNMTDTNLNGQSKTYANRANAEKAVAKLNLPNTVRFFISFLENGRCIPVFVGDTAIKAGTHFHHLTVA